MRIAVISDIHGNNFALEHVLADIKTQKVDQIVCLGDAIQGGPQPGETVGNLRALNCPIVMGNADAWLLNGIETGEELPPERLKKMETIRQWSFSELTDDDRTFISNFESTVTIPLNEELDFLCFHGSPESFDDAILPAAPQEVFNKYLGKYSDSVLAGGHTHAQQIRQNGNWFFFNPGSVGVVYRHDQPDGIIKINPRAEYAILTEQNGQVSLEFRRLPFDVKELVRIYRSSGRPFAEEAIAQYQP